MFKKRDKAAEDEARPTDRMKSYDGRYGDAAPAGPSAEASRSSGDGSNEARAAANTAGLLSGGNGGASYGG